MEERYSYKVEEYFNKSGTFPVLYTWKGQTDLPHEIEEMAKEWTNRNTYIQVVKSNVFEGKYWTGLLFEYPCKRTVVKSKNGRHAVQRVIDNMFETKDYSYHSRIVGSRVYASSCLQAEPGYFNINIE